MDGSAVTRRESAAELRDALRTSRQRHGHSQAACAEALLALGADRASQASISDWENGRTQTFSDAVATAIRAYAEALAAVDDEVLAGLEAQMAGGDIALERIGFLQAMNARLSSAVPMTDAECVLANRLGRAYGVFR